jgi:ankyrin repeat protein
VGGTSLNLSGPNFQCHVSKNTPLMMAVMEGHTDIVRMILERAPNTAVDDVDGERGGGVTPLMAAAGFHHADVLRQLAERGANINSTDAMFMLCGRQQPPEREPPSPRPRWRAAARHRESTAPA